MDETNGNIDFQNKSKNSLSTKIYVSAAIGQMMINFFITVCGTRLFDYYENEIGLDTAVVSLIFIIYALWSIVNTPLIGYFIDKPKKFWRKYGKRFLWIVIGGILWSISHIFLFIVPDLVPNKDWVILTILLLIIICIYSIFFTLYDVSYGGLIPDKFRTDEQRLRVSAFGIGLALMGSVLGGVLPPMIIEYGNRSTFILMAILVSIIGVVMVITQLPGVKEDQWMIDRILSVDTEKEYARFSEMIKIAFKHRNFVAYLCIFTANQALICIMTASLPYIVRFILYEEAIIEAYLLLGFIVAGLISVPLWATLANKLGDFKKTLLIGTILTIIFTVPLFFVNTILLAILATALLGVGLIGIGVIIFPMFGDIIDEATMRNGTRQESFYVGVRTLFARVAIIIQAVTFGLIHIFMGFEPGSSTQSSKAILGLRIQVAIIPMIIMTFGTILFWKFYDLTLEKKEQVQEKLKQLKL